jgi:FdrA protein
LGSGISQAIGTGGRDLSARIEARTTRQALDLLSRDPETEVLGLISKPPDAVVATRLLAYANSLGKPVVVCFVGGAGSDQNLGRVETASSLGRTAERLVARLEETERPSMPATKPPRGRLEGLFSGGTLALEVATAISQWLAPLETNLGIATGAAASDRAGARTHRILDLGADEFTVGRPHPMIDGALRLDRLRAAAADPAVGTILLDVVLGDGAHGDPAAELAPVLEEIHDSKRFGRPSVGILLIGSAQDPQGLELQRERLATTGATVLDSIEAMVRFAADRSLGDGRSTPGKDPEPVSVDLSALQATPVINVGLDSFVESFEAQAAQVIAVDWRPPAGGNERLSEILRRMKGANP